MDTACSVDEHRQTTTPDHDISTMWQRKPRITRQKTSRLLLGLMQVMVPKALQAKWCCWGWWW